MIKQARAVANMKHKRASEGKYFASLETENLLKPLMKEGVLPPDHSLIKDLSLALQGKEEAFFHYWVKKIDKLGGSTPLNFLQIAKNLAFEEHISSLSELVLHHKTRLDFQLQLLELIHSFCSEKFHVEKTALEKCRQALESGQAEAADAEIRVQELSSLPQEVVIKFFPILAREGPQAIPLLQAFADREMDDPDFIMAIAEALSQINHSESVHLLHRIMGKTENKLVLKAIKRALYLLKTRGLEVEETVPTTGGIPRPEFKITSAWASHIDPLGIRIIFSIKTKPFGGFYLTHIVLKELPGIEQCWIMETQKREFQSFYEHITEEIPCTEISPQHFLFLFHEAYQRMITHNHPISENIHQAKEILGEFDLSTFQHPVYEGIDRDKVASEGWLFDRCGKLLELKECAGWCFEEDAVRKYYEEIKALDERQIIVSPQFKQLETNAIYARALQEMIDTTQQHILKRRLEETADLLLKSNQILEARMAVAAAIGLERGPLEKHPLLTEMLTYTLKLLEKAEKGEPEEEVEKGNIIRLH